MNIYTEADLKAAFGRADSALRRGIDTGVNRLLDLTVNEALRIIRTKRKKTRALGAGSTLSQSVGKGADGVRTIAKAPDHVMGTVGTKVPHGIYLEFGTGIYGPKGKVIKPKTAKALAWKTTTGFQMVPGVTATGKAGQHRKRTSRMSFAMWVRGVPPWRWLSGAHLAMRPRTLGVLKKALKEAGV